ncbi:MAG: hypothetical protein KJ057_07375 [Phycisphaerae bacterium]|nr:MAG: hypothetical protein F9K17_14960 [Phycisphaerae bacterium]MBE7457031.1 hypothetical protein [Planctomycetia bacterium]MCK6463611.1 hypothetical protein [Phycisphaerae bacterium]MCL4718279.1 hypothetical protein [Phycisphaerae bacterium]NUQ10002.1 hypothetical protein [Phycisphaerae bacterium]
MRRFGPCDSVFRRSALRRAALLIGLSGGSAIAANFTWIGAPGGTWRPWQTTANWFSAACFLCYPDDPSDNATITADYEGVNVELQQNESIGKLTINTDTNGGGDVLAFRSQASETNVLTVEGGDFQLTRGTLEIRKRVCTSGKFHAGHDGSSDDAYLIVKKATSGPPTAFQYGWDCGCQ